MQQEKKARIAFVQKDRYMTSEPDGTLRELVKYPPNSTFRVWRGDTPDQYDMHWHSAVEICAANRGVCEYIVNNEKYTLREGEVIIVPSGAPHSMEMGADAVRHVYVLELDSLLVLQDFTSLRSLMMFPIHITLDSPILKEATALLAAVAEEYDTQNRLRELRNYARVLELYTLVGRNYLDTVSAQAGASPARQRVYLDVFNDVMKYIDLHYQEPLTLEGISARAGFSKYHFSRLFKQYANTTFYHYLSLKRVMMAERLLATSDMPVTEIALLTGFGSIPTFNRTYKQIRQYTPTEFRSLYRTPARDRLRPDWR